MTTKEKFLQTLKAKIKVYQDAYDYNSSLPDDVFESLNGTSKHEVVVTSHRPKVVIGNEYGANINAVRDIIKASGSDGTTKGNILEIFPGDDENKKYTIVTNALSSLMKGNDIEKFKPKGIRMRGYFFRMKP